MRVPRLLSVAILALSSALTATLAHAQKTIHIPADQPTIQAGIVAATTGDTVLVSPGTYYENIDFLGKAITVTSVAGAATTIIDGGAKAPVVTFQTSETRASTLSSLTLRNGINTAPNTSGTGTGGPGGTGGGGGGVFVYKASPSILNNVITANACNGAYLAYSGALFQANTVSATALPTQKTYAYCSFEGNGIVAYGSSAGDPLLVTGNTVSNNGAGIPNVLGYGNYGDGILLYAAENAVVRSNTAFANANNGIETASTESATISGNLLYGNTAAGLVVYVPTASSGQPMLITGNTITANMAKNLIPLTCTNSGGMQACVGGSLSNTVLANNIAAGNSANPIFLCEVTGPSPAFSHNDFYNASGPAFGPSYSPCIYPTGTNGNLSTDPIFNSPTTADYHLQRSSPAIDAGDNTYATLPTDLDGNPRIQNTTGTPTAIVDIGAYEYTPTVTYSTTTAVATSLTPSPFAQPVTFTAEVFTAIANGAATGSILFADGPTPLATIPLTTQNGCINCTSVNASAVYTTSTLTAGTHTITATYVPTGAFTASTASLTQVITAPPAVPTTTTVMASPATIPLDGTTILAIAVTTSTPGVYPAGTVVVTRSGQFSATPLATATLDASGHASVPLHVLPAGPTTLLVTFTGTGYGSSSGTVVVTVSQAASTVTLSANPLKTTALAPVTFSAHVAGVLTTVYPPGTVILVPVPTGSVILTLNGSPLSVLPVDSMGNATVSAPLPPPSGSIVATYSGDRNYLPSPASAPVTVVVTAAPTLTTLSATPMPAYAGQTVTLAATVSAPGVSSIPAGSVTLTDTTPTGQSGLGTFPLTAAGSISFPTTTLTPGNHLLSATYTPANATFASSQSTLLPLTVLVSDFTVAVTPVTLTLQTEHHATLTVAVTSLGAFAGPVTLSCPQLPPVATCTFPTNTVQLTPAATATTQFTLDTDAVLGFKASLTPIDSKPRRTDAPAMALTFATFIPFTLLLTRRRRSRVRTLLTVLFLAAAATTLTACSGLYPAHTPPGVYTIPITATTSQGTHTTTLTLTVTE